MQKLTTIIQIIMGLMLVVFGLNGFLGFLPQPELPVKAGAFFGALLETGFMIPLIMGIEVLVGLALLANRGVPLALTVLAPVVVNIVAFHIFLAPAGSAPGIFLAGMTLFLAWRYRDAYRDLWSTNQGALTSSEVQERALVDAA